MTAILAPLREAATYRSLLGLLSQIPQDTAQVQPPDHDQTDFAEGSIRGRRKRR